MPRARDADTTRGGDRRKPRRRRRSSRRSARRSSQAHAHQGHEALQKVCKPIKKKKKASRRRPSTPKPPSPARPSPFRPPRRRPSRRRRLPAHPPPVAPPDPPPAATRSSTAARSACARPSACCGARASVRRPGEAEALAAHGPAGSGAQPHAPERRRDARRRARDARPTARRSRPHDAWGHDHLWWLDRMVRSDQPLVERMTLILHDWFATSQRRRRQPRDDDRPERAAPLARARLVHRPRRATSRSTRAMLVFLSGIDNRRNAINENYGRELMELFTLGADRGAYTETDVRELARALSGWRADWQDADGFVNFRFDPNRHDSGTKTLWAGTAHARSGAFNWSDAVHARAREPLPPLVLRAASCGRYFVPSPPNAATQAALESLYVSSGRSIGAVVEAILLHPDLYLGAPLVKPPAVYNAGLLRATGQTITTEAWVWLGDMSGQMLFYPPNVSGWNDRAWLDTSTPLRPLGPRQRGRCGSPSARRRTTPARPRPARRRWRPRSRTSATRRCRRRRWPCCRRFADQPRPAGAERGGLPRAAPERAAPSSSRPPPTARSADGRLLRRLHPLAPAPRARSRRPAPGLPVVEPGMPIPAGTGLTRRSVLLRSAGLALAVYGAGKTLDAAGLRGRRRRGRGRAPRARVDLHGRRRRRAEPARAGQRRALHRAAPDAADRCRAPGRPSRPTRGCMWHPSAQGLRELWDDAGVGVAVAPAIGYDSPNQSHFTSRHFWEVGATDPNATTGWLGRYLDRVGSVERPDPGAEPRRQPLAAARDVDGRRRRDEQRQRLPVPGARRLGHDADADARDLRASSAPLQLGRPDHRAGAPGAGQRGAAVDRPRDGRHRRAAGGRELPGGEQQLQDRLQAVARLLGTTSAAGDHLPVRCVTLNAQGGYDTHSNQATDFSNNLLRDRVEHPRVLARPRAARRRRPRRHHAVERVRPPARRRTARAPTTAPPARRSSSARTSSQGLIGEFPGLAAGSGLDARGQPARDRRTSAGCTARCSSSGFRPRRRGSSRPPASFARPTLF